MQTRLGVNVDHIATIRQARRIDEPKPVDAALLAEKAGADGITIHLREDRRHIQDFDVYDIRKSISIPLNFEMGLDQEIQRIALKVMPRVVTIVPEKREEVTTEGGLDVVSEKARILEFVKACKDAGIRTSLFIDPEVPAIDASAELGVDAVELHTGAYAEAWRDEGAREVELQRLEVACAHVLNIGVELIAGHGLNYVNTAPLLARMPLVAELNIGHSIVGRAAMVGMDQAVREMIDLMENA